MHECMKSHCVCTTPARSATCARRLGPAGVVCQRSYTVVAPVPQHSALRWVAKVPCNLVLQKNEGTKCERTITNSSFQTSCYICFGNSSMSQSCIYRYINYICRGKTSCLLGLSDTHCSTSSRLRDSRRGFWPPQSAHMWRKLVQQATQ